MTNQIVNQTQAQIIEQVVINGDLSALSPSQRVDYYKSVCQSIGLNPLTKPFDYINLNGKLTLYARKDAADQLRKINGVSILDVDITETEKQYVVKVKGQDKTGRADVEIGVVNKTDMRGDAANAMMKAVTKGKRRLTLSLCGLGWLDETEIESIPDAKPVIVNPDTGVIINEYHPDSRKVDDEENEPTTFDYSSLPDAVQQVRNSSGLLYTEISSYNLQNMLLGISKAVKANSHPEKAEEYAFKSDAIKAIIKLRQDQGVGA